MSYMPGLPVLQALYQTDEQGAKIQQARYQALKDRFTDKFGDASGLRYFSAPGRTELAGNHTDHNHGCVLAAAIDLDSICAARPNHSSCVRLWSQGYDACFQVDLNQLEPVPGEIGTTCALIRGVCAAMRSRGVTPGGFDAVCSSQVAVGSGLSSSAAFEVMLATVVDGLFGAGDMPPILRAQAAQEAENRYFGKPSGLMDQAASAVGALVGIDFGAEQVMVSPLHVDFSAQGYVLAVTFTGGSHDDLTECYAAIPADMRKVAAFFGVETLRQVDPEAFENALAQVRAQAGDRAVLRAMHFFEENQRVIQMQRALDAGDMQTYLDLTVESGRSSFMQLQNVQAPGEDCKLALALALSRRLLEHTGAWRVHGGGFAGTILAVVPVNAAKTYREKMEAVFGTGSVRVLQVRKAGAVEVPAGKKETQE